MNEFRVGSNLADSNDLKILNSEHVYDTVFKTLAVKYSSLLIPVINKLFDEHHTLDSKVIFNKDEHLISTVEDSAKHIFSDSNFTIESNGEKKDYIFECQSTPDNQILFRLTEYSIASALEKGEIASDTLEITIPSSAVLFLRSSKSLKSKLFVNFKTPAGNVEYAIPVMKINNYSLDDIFKDKLLFLIPFYIFNYEKKFKDVYTQGITNR